MILYTHTHTHTGIPFNELLNTITLGDSYKIIKEIPDNSVNLIYTDIPYLFADGGSNESSLSKRIKRLKQEELKDITKGIDYSILNEFIRVMKKVNCFIWCSKEQILDILNFFKSKGCMYEILTWNKTNPTPMTNNNFLPDIEYCLYFRETGVKLNDGYSLKSKWYISPINKNDKNKYLHPTIKPFELVKRHILHTTNEKDIVLDCFSGSGTTCVVSKSINRQFIGIEIEPKYYKISMDRLDGILANGQTSMFIN